MYGNSRKLVKNHESQKQISCRILNNYTVHKTTRNNLLGEYVSATKVPVYISRQSQVINIDFGAKKYNNSIHSKIYNWPIGKKVQGIGDLV